MKRAFLLLPLLAAAALAQVSINTVSLPDGYTNGIYYQQTLSASIAGPLANTQTVLWSLAPGSSLPPGLNLDASGNINGFPSSTGLYSFVVVVQVKYTAYTSSSRLSINIATPRVTITTDTVLSNGLVNQQFQQTLLATGVPQLPVQWSVPQNTLPPGLTLGANGVLAGVPLSTGTYSFTVMAALANTTIFDTKQFTITIYAGQVHILSDPNLPTAIIGQPYRYTLQVTPADSVWGRVGIFPFGLTLDANTGIISGTPQSVGEYDFTLTASSPNFAPDSRPVRLFVASGPLSILDTSLPIALLYNPYQYQLTAQGGIGPFQWRTIGSLPPGLSLNINTGLLSGRATSTGPVTFSIQVTDASGATFARSYTLLVAGSLTILTANLPPGFPGVPYYQTLSAGGGQAPFTWSILSGTIPPGLQFSSAGVLSGTPTRGGAFTFTVGVTDNLGNSSNQTLTLAIGGITINLDRLPDAGFGVPYSQLFTASGGNPPYTFTVIGGSLPPGLSLDLGGTLSGTPTLVGSFGFTIQATDLSGIQMAKAYNLNVALPLQLLTTSLPGAAVGTPYSTTLVANGGTPPYNWSVELGALPQGFNLDAKTGVISGNTSAIGPSSFGILLTDSGSQAVHKNFTIVAGAGVFVTSGDLAVTTGANFSYTLTAAGGAPPYRWSIVNGTLPQGLALDGTTGILSGVANTPGASPVTFLATDANNLSGQKVIVITVTPGTVPPVTIQAPDTVTAGQQPTVTLSIPNTFPVDITGMLVLGFFSSEGGDDQMPRFSNGTRSVNYVIPAGSTEANFTGITGPLTFLTGTVAGSIGLTANSVASGTPYVAAKQIALNADVPVITSVALQPAAGGLNVVVTGYSTTRDMVTGLFHFTPATSTPLMQSDFTLPLTDVFTAWYAGSTSNATGGQFTLTLPFNFPLNSVRGVTVSLVNSIGASAPANSQ